MGATESGAALPVDLDARLEEHGYRYEAETSVQVLDLASLRVEGHDAATIGRQLDSSWIANFCQVNAIDERHAPTTIAMINSIKPVTAFATIQQDGKPVAVGMAVRERDHVGLFDLVTATHRRDQGIGARLVSSLLRWGHIDGATTAYLQVLLTNAPALHPYGKLGFKEAYRYWYRVKT